MRPEDDAAAPDALDLSGLVCPQVVLRLADHLRDLAPGSTVTVVATDPMSAIDVPYFLDRRGDRLVSRRRLEGRLVFVIEKGGDGAGA